MIGIVRTEKGKTMTKVWCAETECKLQKNNRCTAKEINLSAGHIHTMHQGFMHHWECRMFEQSEDAKELFGMLKSYFDGMKGKYNG